MHVRNHLSLNSLAKDRFDLICPVVRERREMMQWVSRGLNLYLNKNPFHYYL